MKIYEIEKRSELSIHWEEIHGLFETAEDWEFQYLAKGTNNTNLVHQSFWADMLVTCIDIVFEWDMHLNNVDICVVSHLPSHLSYKKC